MRLGKTLGLALLAAAALAVWLPAFSDARRAPALAERVDADAEQTGTRVVPDTSGFSGRRVFVSARDADDRAQTLLALDALLPDGARSSLADLAERPAARDAGAAVWDELALRWTRRVARERALHGEEAR